MDATDDRSETETFQVMVGVGSARARSEPFFRMPSVAVVAHGGPAQPRRSSAFTARPRIAQSARAHRTIAVVTVGHHLLGVGLQDLRLVATIRQRAQLFSAVDAGVEGRCQTR
jgi:hypothetical protein